MKKQCYIFLFFTVTIFGQNNALFDQGKEQYKAENYQEAITSWKKIIDSGQHSAATYFNLGNAFYKQNRIGPSIYYYEKALQLSPSDTEIRTNLAFAENARIDVIKPLPKTVFSKWYSSVTSAFTFEEWALFAVIFSFLFVLTFLLYYFSTSERLKRSFFIGSLISVLFFLGALILAYFTYGDEKSDVSAIIFTETVEIKSEPKINSDTAFKLHEGTKVQIVATDGDWLKIMLADGTDGWIPASDLKKL
jgi:tetratricopeptide (TPR) repeat protein